MAVRSHFSRPIRTVSFGQSLVGSLLALGSLGKHHARHDGSDQEHATDTSTNNNGDFVLLEEGLERRWVGVLEFNSTTNNLALWRWIRRVEAVLFEAFRAEVRPWGNWVGLEPCTIDGSALEATSVCRVSSELTLQEPTESGILCLL